MRTLRTRFRTREDFLAAFNDGTTGPGLFCATTTPIDAGDRVLCDIHFPDLPNHVVLKGWAVRWRPAVPRLGVRAGADVALDANQETQIAYLVGVARGTRKPGPRRHTSLPIELPIKMRVAGSTDAVEAGLREISVSGAVLRPPRPLKSGAGVILEIRAPGGAGTTEIAGVVTEQSGEMAAILFQARDTGGVRRLRELVRRFRFGASA